MPVTMQRQKIMDALSTRMATILTTGGYYTNIGAKVSTWRAKPYATAELPAINIRDLKETIEAREQPMAYHYRSLDVELQVVCNSATSDTTVRQMITDVEKAIGTDPTFGGLAIDTEALGDEINVKQEENLISGATISIQILYRTLRFQEA